MWRNWFRRRKRTIEVKVSNVPGFGAVINPACPNCGKQFTSVTPSPKSIKVGLVMFYCRRCNINKLVNLDSLSSSKNAKEN